MQKKFNLCFIFIFILILFSFNKPAYAQPFKKNILIISSYHRGYEWNDNIENGITSTLKKYNENYNIKIEYLDALNINVENYNDKLIKMYNAKYSNSKIDLLMCSDNAAYNFFLENRSKLLPDVPLIFTGLNNFEMYESQSKIIKNSTGVLENIDIEGNIDLILRLHPSTKKIFILIDNTLIGNALHNSIDKLPLDKYNVKLELIAGYTLESSLEKINSVPEESAILYAAASINTNSGNTLYLGEAVRNLKDKTHLPIYGVWDVLLGNGIIGGKVTSSLDQGAAAGELAKKILDGEDIKTIPISRDVKLKYAFDYNELNKFKISEEQLPKGSSILNEPSSVYSISKKYWQIISCCLLATFLFIIVFLIMNIEKRKKTELKLRESEIKIQHSFNFLRTLLDTVKTPIFCKNIDGKFTDCNSAFEEYVGVKKFDLLNNTSYNFAETELADIYKEADLRLLEERGTQVYESELITKDNQKHDVIFNKSTIISNDEPIGIVGVILDITERKKSEDKNNRLSKFKEAMIEVNQAIIGISDVNELFNLILLKSTEIMKGAEYGSVLVLQENNILTMAASIGYDHEKINNFNVPLENCFHCLKTKGKIEDTVIIDNVSELYSEKYIDCSDEAWRIVTSISTPIIIDDKLFGMINIDSDKKGTFDEDDIYIMNYMKQQIENSIRTLNLYNEIIYLSKYDKLTNIYNRRSFEELFDRILSDSIKYNSSFSLVIFDLNDLKLVNDKHGHLQGDEYIKEFVDKLKTTITECDILARYGGDEFIGVFFSTDIDSLSKMFEYLNSYFISNPLILDGNKVTYSYSYGIASFPTEATSYSHLVKIADEKMYAYKESFKKSL